MILFWIFIGIVLWCVFICVTVYLFLKKWGSLAGGYDYKSPMLSHFDSKIKLQEDVHEINCNLKKLLKEPDRAPKA